MLQKALEVFNIELIPYASQHPIAQQARQDPLSIQAYICNLREHWLTIRRFGQQYFDLNSISNHPKLISDTFLSLYLAQLKQSGYSIFIVTGDLAKCSADERLTTQPIDPAYYRSLTERAEKSSSSRSTRTASSGPSSFDDQELQRAIKASEELDTADDKALQEALAQSLKDAPNAGETESYDQELLNQAIAASLMPPSPEEKPIEQPSVEGNWQSNERNNDKNTMSDLELRQRRLQFFENKNKDPAADPEWHWKFLFSSF